MKVPFAHRPQCRFAALLLVALLPRAGKGEETPGVYTSIDAAVQANRLIETRSTGLGKGSYRETSAQPGVLVGFEVGLGRFGNIEVIHALRPVYNTSLGERLGPAHGLFAPGTKDGKAIRSDVTRTVSVKAKPGYAVGGMTAR